jgi:glycosyltransferase involved in cell wall biosynthesis
VSGPARRVFVACEDASASSFAANQARRHVDLLKRRGHRASLLAAVIEPRLRSEASPLEWGLAEAAVADVAWVMHYDRWSRETTERLRSARGPRALWFHGFAPPETLDRADPEWERRMHARRMLPDLVEDWDLVLCDSEQDRRRLRRVGAGAVGVVPPLLEDPGLPPAGGRPAPTIVCPGPVTAGRGLDHAVTALALVRRLHRPDARMVVAGSGRGHERFIAGLTTLAARVHVDGAMGVADGSEEAVPPAALALDLAADGRFPAWIVAARMRGYPAIVVAGGPAAELVGEGALVLPDAGPPLVAEAIAEVLADAALRAALSADARAVAAAFAGAAAEERAAAALAPLLG